MLKDILFGGENGLSFAGNAGLALLRIFTGTTMAFMHGWGKMPPGEKLVESTAAFGFPAPTLFAWAAACSEFFGGIFLALGLFTRLSALGIASTMFVAAFMAHAADPFNKKELALLYLFVAAAYVLKGAGDWSLDAVFRKK